MEFPKPLFDRTIGRPRPWWVTLAVSLGLIMLPFLAAYLDGSWEDIYLRGLWRILLAPPTVIIYTLVIAPLLEKMGADVIVALRPLVELDEVNYKRLIAETAYIRPRSELLALGIGLAFGFWLGLVGGFTAAEPWVRAYWTLSSALMWGILVWVVYLSLVNTRLTVALHRQPMHVDIFNLAPFEPIGRQSLVLALAFVGGISLSLLFSFQPSSLRVPIFWLIYLLLFLVPVLVFFSNMRPTHRVLAAEKTRYMEAVRGQISRAGQNLMHRLELSQDVGMLPMELNALLAYEVRLKETRTWPYNTGILRSLFFSVLIPLVTVLARLAVEFLFK